jgi:hypothetical protein
MFFSTSSNAFRNPKPCPQPNGTLVYYGNHNLDCTCLSQIRADPDFAGPGLIASFIFVCWLTIFVATIPTGYSLVRTWQRTPGPRRFWRFLYASIKFEPLDTEPAKKKRDASGDDPAKKPPSLHATRDSVSSSISSTSLKAPLPAARRFQHLDDAEPPVCVFARRIVLQLCDLQIITGIAILVAALAQVRTLTFYHAQFAEQFWWMTLNSFWVSRIDYSRDSPEMRTARAHVRRVAIWLSVALSIAMQTIIAIREYVDWNPLANGKCYVSSGAGTGFGQNLFWLAGTVLYFAVLSVGLFQASRAWFDHWVNERLEPSIDTTASWVLASWTATREFQRSDAPRSTRHYLSLAGRYARTAGHALVFATWYLTVLFLTIWCAGSSAAALEVIIYSIFAGFLTWWVLFLKVQNRLLIRGDEARMTLGQTLPLLLLMLVAIHALDVWAGVRRDLRRRKGRGPPEAGLESMPDMATAAAMATSEPLEPDDERAAEESKGLEKDVERTA